MALLSAREAARRLGKDERTIRRWIAAGKLQERTSASNRMAIDEQDVDRLAALLTQEDRDKRQEITDLENRIDRLEQEQARILARLALLEDRPTSTPRISRPEPGESYIRPRAPAPRPQSTPLFEQTPDDVPSGSRQATEFAQSHSVHRVTFRDQMTKGVRGDKVDHISIFKRRKQDGTEEFDRWLSPEQQLNTISFWDRHSTNWRRCEVPGCLVCGSGLLGKEISAE